MKGQAVCRSHGGGAPQARAKAEAALALAEAHLRGLAGPAVATLEHLVANAESETVRLAAARDLVNRSVGKATEKIQVAAAIEVVRPW